MRRILCFLSILTAAAWSVGQTCSRYNATDTPYPWTVNGSQNHNFNTTTTKADRSCAVD